MNNYTGNANPALNPNHGGVSIRPSLETVDGEEVRIVPQLGHEKPLVLTAIRRDSNYLLTVDEDRRFAILWEVASGKIIRKYRLDAEAQILSIAFSTRGNLLALGGASQIMVFDILSRAGFPKELTWKQVEEMGETDDGEGSVKHVGVGWQFFDALAKKKPSKVIPALWEEQYFDRENRLIKKIYFDDHEKEAFSQYFDSNGRLTGQKYHYSEDEASKYGQFIPQKKYYHPCTCLIFSHNEEYLFFPQGDSLKVWDIQNENIQALSCENLQEFRKNDLSIKTLDISADGHAILSGLDSADGRRWASEIWRKDWVKENDTFLDRDASIVAKTRGHGENPGSAPVNTTEESRPLFKLAKSFFSPSGQHILLWLNPLDQESGYWIFLLDVAKSNLSENFQSKWHQDIASGSEEQSYKTYDFAYFSADGQSIIFGKEGQMHHWDVSEERIRTIPFGHYYDPKMGRPLIFTHDLNYYFSVGSGGDLDERPVIQMRRTADGEQIRRFAGIDQPKDEKILKDILHKICRQVHDSPDAEDRDFNYEVDENGMVQIDGEQLQLLCPQNDKHLEFLLLYERQYEEEKFKDVTPSPDADLLSQRPNRFFAQVVISDAAPSSGPPSNSGSKIKIEQYYASSKDACRSVAFVKNNRAFQYDQFDVLYNKPHEIFKKFSAFFHPDSQAIHKLERVAAFRRSIMGPKSEVDLRPEIAVLTPIPIDVMEESESIIPISIRVHQPEDRKVLLAKLFIWINGVPVDGTRGISLRERYTTDTIVHTQFQLSKGLNKVRISAVDENGIESLNENYSIFYREKKPDLFLYAIGVSNYQDQDYNLEFAHQDAIDLAEMYRARAQRTNKFFGRLKLKVFGIGEHSEDAKAIPASSDISHEIAHRNNILAIREEIKELSDVDDIVIIFFAGHGVRDDRGRLFLAPSDMNFDTPEEKGISYEEMIGLLDDIPARNKLLLLDACFTGELVRSRRASSKTESMLPPGFDQFNQELSAEDFPELESAEERIFNTELPDFSSTDQEEFTQQVYDQMQSLFVDLRHHTGANVLTSTSGDRLAFERRSLKNGVFTNCLKAVLNEVDIDSEEEPFSSFVASILKDKIKKMAKISHRGLDSRQRSGQMEHMLLDIERYLQRKSKGIQDLIRANLEEFRGGVRSNRPKLQNMYQNIDDFMSEDRKSTRLMASQLKDLIQKKLDILRTDQKPDLRNQNLENDFQIW